MNILWFAFGFYILGVSVVLWVRPSLMFDGDAWKEFGLSQKGNFTIFPFWMFVLVWTFVSYIVGTLCVVGFSGIVAGPSPLRGEGVSLSSSVAGSVAGPWPPLLTPVAEQEPTAPPREATAANIVAAEVPVGASVESDTTVIEKAETPVSLDLIEKPLRKKRAKGYYIRGMIKGKPAYVYYGTESPF
jgi:hypothetical protein